MLECNLRRRSRVKLCSERCEENKSAAKIRINKKEAKGDELNLYMSFVCIIETIRNESLKLFFVVLSSVLEEKTKHKAKHKAEESQSSVRE